PATVWIGIENFHPDSFLGLFIGVALYAALEQRWRLLFVALVLSLSVKEDVALVIIPLGIWLAIRKSRKVGLTTAGVSLWCMIVAIFGIQKGINGVPFRNSWRIPFGGVGGLLKTSLSEPTKLVAH
ncbi:MAG: DUF2079 domain-containing protein, partial [Acidimicrobiaceae bacterium]